MESRFWFEDIRSHSNIGDDPSRGALYRLRGLAQVFQTSVEQVQLTLPPLTAWQGDYNTSIPGTKSASNNNPDSQIVHDFFTEQYEGRFITTFLSFDSFFTFGSLFVPQIHGHYPHTHTTNEAN